MQSVYTGVLNQSSMGPPTKASTFMRAAPETRAQSSVQSLLQFLHGQAPHRLGGRLGFEDARLLGEWVDALLCWSGGLLLQLQVQHACKLEVAILLDLSACHRKESLNDTLHLLV